MTVQMLDMKSVQQLLKRSSFNFLVKSATVLFNLWVSYIKQSANVANKAYFWMFLHLMNFASP